LCFVQISGVRTIAYRDKKVVGVFVRFFVRRFSGQGVICLYTPIAADLLVPSDLDTVFGGQSGRSEERRYMMSGGVAGPCK
jgi:hypothetical protein